ncbi:pentatricopeptide repeat-containing protein At2g04860 [Tripterygium wilfordii]|uniref:pentatricopeptide repeat-containing protein At2g04860 n=1 Tax=Tripterygium wilfordii TaxID=458696 RepID=UPI0018F8233B|nr:pentatricopeptide repeat-containing protein At2g04860 [Tripterygium wilfordii]
MSLASTIRLSYFHSSLKSYIERQDSKSALLLLRQFLQSTVKPNDFTFSLLLKSYASSSSALNPIIAKIEVNQTRNHLVKSGIDQFVYVSTALLDLYMKLGCVESARGVFGEMPQRDVVSWNALLCGYSRNGYDIDALDLFVQMLREGLAPQITTLVGLIPSCGRCDNLFPGMCIHGMGIKAGIDFDSQVKNALTSMYAKCGDLGAAKLLFEEMEEKTVVSWNTMIGAYGQNGFFDEALLMFKRMLEESFEVNSVTVLNLLSTSNCAELIHCYVIKSGLNNDVFVITSLVCVYAKCGDTVSAELLNMLSPHDNLVSLTAIISSYGEKGNIGLVVEYFSRVQKSGLKMDAIAMVSILHGIKDPAHSNVGIAFHCYAIKSGLCIKTLVANGLISMYSNFNDIDAALSLFYEMPEKPLITWNSVISGCVQAGMAREAMEVFCQMMMFGQSSDSVTIASLLSGCSQLAYLQFGKRLHSYVLRHDLETEDFVETSLIDMYTKCGSIECAERVFKSINEPCLATWNTMISCYSLNGFERKALTCYIEMLEQRIEPDKITFLGVLAACTHGGLVHEGKTCFQVMTEQVGLVPNLQHCACMVGLLGRAGLFEEAMSFIQNMDIEPDSAVWGALLNACRIHQEIRLGESLAKKLYLLDYRNGGLYVLMSNLYAATGRWDDVERVRKMMKGTEGDGCTGVSQIEVTSFYEINRTYTAVT